MPIYEYECGGCSQVFAVRQKVSDPAPTSHDCGSQQVRRILSATSFVLKGTGWYKTDYADKARPAEGSGATPDGASEAKGKAEGKPDQASADKAGQPAGQKAAGASEQGKSSATANQATSKTAANKSPAAKPA